MTRWMLMAQHKEALLLDQPLGSSTLRRNPEGIGISRHFGESSARFLLGESTQCLRFDLLQSHGGFAPDSHPRPRLPFLQLVHL